MLNRIEIMDVALPVEVVSDLTIEAGRLGVETSEFLGALVLLAAYGSQHPLVRAYRKRANLGQSGPLTRGDDA